MADIFLLAPVAIDVRLTVSVTFMITAAVATALHAWLYREARKDQKAYTKADGLGIEVSKSLVRVEFARLILMGLLAIAGFGATFGLQPGWEPLRQAGWLIALLPAVSVWGSIRDLQSRKKQVLLAEELAKRLADHPAKPEE